MTFVYVPFDFLLKPLWQGVATGTFLPYSRKPAGLNRAGARVSRGVAEIRKERPLTRTLACALLIALAAACEAEAPRDAAPAAPAAAGPLSVRAQIGAARFDLELVADQATRQRGMGGRRSIDPSSGMLFAFRRAAPREFLMRDCVIPLDIAFLDASARVVALHTMSVEPPRRRDETVFAYESRLPLYGSGSAAQFAIETAAGRLAEVGLAVGDVVEFDRAAVLKRTR